MTVSAIPQTINQGLEQGRKKFLAKYSDQEFNEMARAYDIERVWLNSLLIKNTQLQKCSAVSLRETLGSVVTSGLTLSPAFGECYVIPYGQQAQLQISYIGLIKLLTDSGSVTNVEAHVVYENDFFEYELGLTKKFKHVPTLKNRGELIAVYAIAHIRGAEPQVELLTADDVEAARSMSKSANKPDSPWVKFPAEMWRKTAVKRLFKYLPKTKISDELMQALSAEHAAEVQTISIDATTDPDLEESKSNAAIFAPKQEQTPEVEQPKRKRGRPRKNPETPEDNLPGIPARKTIPPKIVTMPGATDQTPPPPIAPPEQVSNADIFTSDQMRGLIENPPQNITY